MLIISGRVGSTGNKERIACGLNTCAVLNCADNTGAKALYIIAVKCYQGRLNRMPKASVADLVLCSCKKGKPELRKKGIATFLFILRFSE